MDQTFLLGRDETGQRTRRGTSRRSEFARLLGVAGAGGLLAACGRAAEPSPAPGARAPVTIRHLARGGDAYLKLQRELRDLFQTRNPSITVEVDDSPGDFYQKFVAQAASGTPPDAVFECDCGLGSSVRSGLVQQLDPWLAKEKRYKADAWHDVTWYASTYRGKRWGLPWDGGSLLLYYNRDLFQAANVKEPDPKKSLSWEELLPLAQRLTMDANGRRAGESGFDPNRVTQYGFEPSRGLWQLYIFGAGGEVIEKDGTVPIDSAAALAGLRYLDELMHKFMVSPSPRYQLPSPVNWQSGSVAMNYAGVWNLAAYREQLKFNWDVAPTPAGKNRATLGWWSMLAMTAESKQKDAAWEWIFWNVSEEGLRHAVTTGVSMPPLKSLRQAFTQPEKPPKNQDAFYEELDPKILRAPGDRYGSYFGDYVTEFRRIFNRSFDPVWRGERPVTEAAREARPKLEHLLKTGEET
jgi:multiple sugar transport system substrate-binding protein